MFNKGIDLTSYKQRPKKKIETPPAYAYTSLCTDENKQLDKPRVRTKLKASLKGEN